MHKRAFDILFSFLLLLLLFVPIAIIAIMVKSTSSGPVLFWSPRVGKNNNIFQMPKFRTMLSDAPLLATHLVDNPESLITPIGRFLRRSSADELPQLYSVIIGKMSLVGPRPALYNQYDLIALRTEKGVHKLKPGVTGLAQIRLRDKATIEQKAEIDEEYLHRKSFILDIFIIGMTVRHVLFPKNISH